MLSKMVLEQKGKHTGYQHFISIGESNTVVSAYPLYRHLEQYCFHLSTYFHHVFSFTLTKISALQTYVFLLENSPTFYQSKICRCMKKKKSFIEQLLTKICGRNEIIYFCRRLSVFRI